MNSRMVPKCYIIPLGQPSRFGTSHQVQGESPMNHNRRNFMMTTGAVCAMALTGRPSGAQPAAPAEIYPAATNQRGMARGLTVLNIRRGAEYRLGVKNERGVL